MPNYNTDSQQYLQEMGGAIRGQANILPQVSQIEANLAPDLMKSQFGGQLGYATGLLGIYNDLFAPTQQFQSQYAQAQLGMLGGLGQQATQASINSLDSQTRNIYNLLGNQAYSDLALGSGLNQQDTEYAQQAARAAAQSRGLQFSRQGSDLEILNTYNLGQKRLEQRKQYATQAFQIGQGLQQFGAQTYLQPSYGASQPYSMGGVYGVSQEGYQGLGPNFLQPESQYLANIRANRIQSENAAAAAAAQKSAANASAIGSVVGLFAKKAFGLP